MEAALLPVMEAATGGEALTPGEAGHIQEAELHSVEADMALASVRTMALAMVSSTMTDQTALASMDPVSIPTWGPIRRTSAQVGITSGVDEEETAAMGDGAGTRPVARSETSSGTCPIGSSGCSNEALLSNIIRHLRRFGTNMQVSNSRRRSRRWL